MKISILIPCYNEEKSVRKSAQSWLAQTRPADEIIVVDDCSTDGTAKALEEFRGVINLVRTPRNTGNKSSAQEYGLNFMTGDVMITTDGDTLLDRHFVERIEEDFKNPAVAAVGGYVRSLKYNWLTACRALDYAIGHNIDKLAQDYMNYLFVIPGAAGAFRTDVFRSLGFEHDTVTEDLDFTYKLHKMGKKILYDREAICYTQDPADFRSYINQERRWFGGGWQCFVKHMSVPDKPGMALELSFIYGEGLVFSILLFALPLVNVILASEALGSYFFLSFALSFFGAAKERRWDLLRVIPQYVFLKYVNAWIYLEQFLKEVVLHKKNLVWFKPERVEIKLPAEA
jgi:cellulose synthase/poly-beta-1,6-N-acetylglucosamine synthase-like glycosyltransferase